MEPDVSLIPCMFPRQFAPCLSAPVPVSRSLSAACNDNYPMQQRSFSKRMMMALFPTLKGAARPITTYHHIKHASATSHKNESSKFFTAVEKKSAPRNLKHSSSAV